MKFARIPFTPILGAVALCCCFAFSAHAQSLKLDGGGKPIDVTADNGIELQQDNKRVIARGNAKAVQGEVSVLGDELIADYRAKADGGNEVYRVFARGNVTMKSANETATGEAAVYDFDKGVLVLEGSEVSLVNADGSVVAHQELQYWSNEKVAVAEGSAVAIDKEKRKLYGDKLIAFFREDPKPTPGDKSAKNQIMPQNKGDITLLQGFGNVRMETPKETVRGDRGTYNLETGIATLDGAVKITQNQNQLSGGFAVVNVKGGTSRLFANAKAAGMPGVRENTRVSALIAPKPKDDAPNASPQTNSHTPAPSAPAPGRGQK